MVEPIMLSLRKCAAFENPKRNDTEYAIHKTSSMIKDARQTIAPTDNKEQWLCSGKHCGVGDVGLLMASVSVHRIL